MKNRNIVIIGGDKRQKYLKTYLISKGYDTESYGLFDWDDDNDRLKSLICPKTAVVLPLPATRNEKTVNMPFSKRETSLERVLSLLGKDNIVFGGIIRGELLSRLRETEIPFVDYYDAQFIEKNAVLTAFGTLKILLEHIDFVLSMGNYAVTGYGRVAKETAAVLNSLSCKVTVFARNPSQRQDAVIKGCNAFPVEELSRRADEFDIIINTVPSQIIGRDVIKNMKKDGKIIELASAPYGVDFDEARKNSIDVIKAFGLPGKYTPKTAGEIIGKRIEEFLQREEKE